MGAETQVQGITFQIVEIEGRAISGIKLLGMLTEEQYGQEDFSLYVRWDEAHGIVTVDRSDTDERLITQGLTRVGKLEAFQNLMHLVASKYGTDVVVAADPGLKVSAMAAKMIGTYAAPEQAEVEISTDRATEVRSCTVAGCKSGQPGVMLLKIATGPSAKYTNDTVFCGVCWPWYRNSTELGNVVESIPLAVEISTPAPECAHCGRATIGRDDQVTPFPHECVTAEDLARFTAFNDSQDAPLEIPTNTPVIEGYEWKRHVNPGEAVWAGSTYQLIEAGSVCQVIATVKHRGHGKWAAQSATWGNTGLTEDFWAGESLVDAFTNVVKFIDFLNRARAALPIRTPGASWAEWDAAEMEIWAGTDQVVKMRFPRKMKKAWRKAHLVDLRMPRPVDVKRARVAKGSVR